MAEKVRAAGFGIPAFYTATGLGTWVEEGGMPLVFKKGGKEIAKKSKPKPRKNFNGRDYLYEETIFADYAIVKAWKSDKIGNLIFRKTARNFNQDMATAARVTIAEVEEIVETGTMDPDFVHTPAVFVDRIFQGPKFEKKISKLVIDEQN